MEYKQKHTIKNDYKKQIILRFVMIFLFFVMLFGVIVIKNVYTAAHNDANAAKNLKLTQIRQNFDFRIDMALNVMEELKRSQEMAGWIGDDSDYMSITKIYERLAENPNAYTRQNFLMAVQKPYGDIVITPQGTMIAKDFYRTYGIQSGVVDQNMNKSYAFVESSRGSDGANQLILQMNEAVGSPENKLVFFVFINKSDIVPEMPSNEKLVISSDEKAVFCSDDTYEGDAAMSEIYASVVEQKKGGSDIADVKLKSEYVKLSFSNARKFYNVSFALLSDRNMAEKTGEVIDVIFMPLIVLLFIFGLYMALRIARGIYEPVVKLKNYYKELFGEETDIDEFEFIEESTRRLTASYSEMLRERQMSGKYARDSFFYALVLGLIGEKEAQEHADTYAPENTDKPCIVCIIDIEDFINSTDSVLKSDADTLDRLEQDASEAVSAYFACDITAIDKGRFAQIVYTDDEARLKSLFSAVAADLEKEYGVCVRIIMGSVCPCLTAAGESYLAARRAATLVSAYSNQVVYTQSDALERPAHNSFYYPIEKERLLISYVLNCKKEQALKLLSEILSVNYEQNSLSDSCGTNLILAVAGTINRILQESKKSIDDIFGEGTMVYLELKMQKSEKQLCEKITEMFSVIADSIEQEDEEINTRMSESLLGYIDDNYFRDISLVDIAAAFNLSTGYISALFKRTTGKNFKEYLNIRRLEAAKRLMLSKKGMKVKDIAQRVGCNNVNTFIRMFKKYEGMSPGEFLSGSMRYDK